MTASTQDSLSELLLDFEALPELKELSDILHYEKTQERAGHKNGSREGLQKMDVSTFSFSWLQTM
mgnify:CR=1 FL=1